MSKINIEIADELDFDFEEGDSCIHIKSDGTIGKVFMPEMNSKVVNSTGYRKLLDVIDILKPGAKNEFIKYNQGKIKGRLH